MSLIRRCGDRRNLSGPYDVHERRLSRCLHTLKSFECFYISICIGKRTCSPTTEISADLAKKMLWSTSPSINSPYRTSMIVWTSPAEPEENGGEERHRSWSTVVRLAVTAYSVLRVSAAESKSVCTLYFGVLGWHFRVVFVQHQLELFTFSITTGFDRNSRVFIPSQWNKKIFESFTVTPFQDFLDL
jgi:hypothetical protein